MTSSRLVPVNWPLLAIPHVLAHPPIIQWIGKESPSRSFRAGLAQRAIAKRFTNRGTRWTSLSADPDRQSEPTFHESIASSSLATQKDVLREIILPCQAEMASSYAPGAKTWRLCDCASVRMMKPVPLERLYRMPRSHRAIRHLVIEAGSIGPSHFVFLARGASHMFIWTVPHAYMTCDNS
jgi:hypothetical protein